MATRILAAVFGLGRRGVLVVLWGPGVVKADMMQAKLPMASQESEGLDGDGVVPSGRAE